MVRVPYMLNSNTPLNVATHLFIVPMSETAFFNPCRDFAKKCFVQKLWHNLLTSSSSGVHGVFFFHKIIFYASFEAYSYVFTVQTTGLWKIACDSLAQTRERHRYVDHKH